MGNQILGYSLSGVGILVLASSFDSIKSSLAKFIPFLTNFSSLYLQLIGGALVILGVFFLMGKGKSKQASEVPIYQGKNVIGYRRQ